jgi:hypothetical protein
MKRIVLLVLAVGLVAVPAAAAKKPPSFALWSARESNYDDALLSHAKNGKDVVAVLAKAKPHWEHGLTVIAKPQKVACKKQIHAYWLAAVKFFDAEMLYARTHLTTSTPEMGAALTGDEPYATLNDVKNETKSHAVRICG